MFTKRLVTPRTSSVELMLQRKGDQSRRGNHIKNERQSASMVHDGLLM